MHWNPDAGAVGATFADPMLNPGPIYLPGDDRYSRVIRWLERRYPAPRLEAMPQAGTAPLDDAGARAVKSMSVRVRMRHALALRFSWSIPSPRVLDVIAKLTRETGIVEAGAGTGYWASLLAARGVDVRAFDRSPPGSGADEGEWHSEAPRSWHPVEEASVEDMPFDELGDRALLLCWPPYEDPMGATAVRRYHAAGGETVVFIGEVRGNAGDGELWTLLEGSYEWDDDDEEEARRKAAAEKAQLFVDADGFAEMRLPRWYGLRDQPVLYRRK